MTRSTTTIAVLLAAAGSAVAQDSVLSTFGSDALSPYASDNQQGANYVVDLTAFNTSWGTEFGIAPILKTTQTDVTFNNNLGSAQSLSRGVNLGVSPMGGNYQLWNAVGGGINAAAGQTSSLINPPANVNRMAAGIDEFNFEYSGIIGGMIEFDPANPGRLFISRRQIAQGVNEAADFGDASLGGLAVNRDGQFFYRADGFNVTGAANVLSGNNILRTDLAARNPAIPNKIDVSGAGMDATDWMVIESGETVPVPTYVPGSDAFGVVTFNDQYVYGNTAGAPTFSAADAHLDSSQFISQNRGSIGATGQYSLDANGVAQFGIIGRNDSGSYRNINTWSVDSSGAQVGSPLNFPFPDITPDNDASALGYSFDGSVLGDWPNSRPYSYYGQTSFAGGVGQIGMGMDQQGRALAAFFYGEGDRANPDNHMVAVRFDPTAADPLASAEHGLVSFCYYDTSTSTYEGKDITDGVGNVIGQLIPLDGVTGGAPFGPSFSPPSIDSAGNVWFQAAVELYARFDVNDDGVVDALDDVDLTGPIPGVPDGISDWSDTDGALIRAVYDHDNANGPAWELELVLELGTTITGSNSGVDWRINFMGTANSSNLASSTFFSNNASEVSFNGFDVSALPSSDSRTNGGVVVNASIVYDVDGDGDFWTDDTAVGNETTLDQNYNVLLYIGNLNAEDPIAGDPCDGIDFLADGILDNGDIGAFIAAFLAGDPAADINGDTFLDNGDISEFIALFLSCVG